MILKWNKKWKNKEYFWKDLKFDGEYKNGKRIKGKEYDRGTLLYDGEFSKGKKQGKGKEYNYKNKLVFEGIYLNGIKWTEKGYDKWKDFL